MSWHYLAVRKRQGADRWIDIHEVYLDRGGRIAFWTEDAMSVRGDDLDDLVLGLRHMLYDVVRWGVVDEAELRARARLTPRRTISQDTTVLELIDALRSTSRLRDLRASLVERMVERRARHPKRRGRVIR